MIEPSSPSEGGRPVIINSTGTENVEASVINLPLLTLFTHPSILSALCCAI